MSKWRFSLNPKNKKNTPMSNIYGPYDEGDWRTLIMLKNNVAFMKSVDRQKFATAIAKETRLLRKYINGELKEVA